MHDFQGIVGYHTRYHWNGQYVVIDNIAVALGRRSYRGNKEIVLFRIDRPYGHGQSPQPVLGVGSTVWVADRSVKFVRELEGGYQRFDAFWVQYFHQLSHPINIVIFRY